jgi:putative ABC transport system permease protein
MIPDIRQALRQLIKSPGFTAVAVLTLALGIGVNTTMFSVLDALVIQASPARDSGRLVSIFRTSAQAQNWPQSPANFYDYAGQNASFEQVAAYFQGNSSISEPGQPAERLPGMEVSANFFMIFGIPPEIGRTFGPEYDKAGAGEVAVLSDGFWRSHFAADPGVVGRTVRMDGQQVTIIGVMPAEFENPLYWGPIDVWRPLAFDGRTRQIRENNWMQAIGRLKPGVSVAQAQAEATAIAGRLARAYPLTNEGIGLRLELWNEARVGNVSSRISWLCMALAGFVLVIACANLANLQLARMTGRMREYALRIALGATRFQLMRQLIIESLLLSAVGGAFGVLIASWSTRLIGRAIMIAGVGLDIPINGSVLAFTLAASVLTGVAIGTIPAWFASRTDANTALKQGSRGSTGDRSQHRVRKALIICELALSLVLLAGAGYFVRGMQRFAHADMGWKPDGLLTASLTLPFDANYQTNAQCQAFFDKLSSKLAELPGARQLTITTRLPIVGFWRSSGIAVQGRPDAPHGKEPLVYDASVTPGNFAALGMRLLRGRDFTSADRADTHPVVIINEAMAKELWPGEDPIGKLVGDTDPKARNWREVVGVVNDVHPAIELVRRPDTPFQYYLPLSQTPNQFAHWIDVAIRTSAPEPTVAEALRAAVRQIDADQPVYGISTARESIEQQITSSFTLTAQMLAAFALVGLALSAVGIYGVIAFLAAQRTSEIGIRMALGAQSGDVLWLVLGQGLRLALAGTVIGLACAWGLVRVLAAILPAMKGTDPAAIACVAALLAAVACLASWIPARRATQVDPIIALRGD